MRRKGQRVRESSGVPIWVLLPLYSLLFVGCFRRSPDWVAQRYIENLKQFNYAKCYSLLSAQDRADRSFQQFLTEIPVAPDVSPVWFRPILQVTRFELGREYAIHQGTIVSVPVKVTTPDLPLWERTLDALGKNDGSPAELAQRSLASGSFPEVSYEDEIFLTKENHQWRIKAALPSRERVLESHREAMVDFYAGRLDRSMNALHYLISELKQAQGTGNRGLAARFQAELVEIGTIKHDEGAAAAYEAKLKLDKVAMRMAEERVPAIFGDVTNAGNKPIDELRLAVTWYQGRGKNLQVVQREEHSIVVTPIEFTDFTRQVIPFLPGETRPFGFILEAPPEVQQNATPYVTIASISLTEIPAPLPRLETVSSPQAPPSGDSQIRRTAPVTLASPASGSSSACCDHLRDK